MQNFYGYCENKEETKILSYLSTDKYITSTEISRLTGFSGDKIRNLINSMRTNSIPIVACNKGYRLTESSEEIQEEIDSLLGRISAIHRALIGLKRAKSAAMFYERENQNKNAA